MYLTVIVGRLLHFQLCGEPNRSVFPGRRCLVLVIRLAHLTYSAHQTRSVSDPWHLANEGFSHNQSQHLKNGVQWEGGKSSSIACLVQMLLRIIAHSLNFRKLRVHTMVRFTSVCRRFILGYRSQKVRQKILRRRPIAPSIVVCTQYLKAEGICIVDHNVIACA